MCGGGGGDGGYAERQRELRTEQDRAIAEINTIFGRGDGKPLYTPRLVYGDAPIISSDDNGTVYGQRPVVGEVQDITGYDTAARDANLAERERLYGTVGRDAEARLLDNLGEDRTRAERDVRFQLARQGLAGGSVDIDQGREILDKFQRGSLEARNVGTGAANSARSADERTRVNLISNIRNGMSQSDAISAGQAALTNNANEARDAALSTDIGRFFDDLTVLRGQQQFNTGLQTSGAQYPSRGSGSGTSANAGGFNGRIN